MVLVFIDDDLQGGELSVGKTLKQERKECSSRLSECEHVHRDGPERLGFPTDHAPNPFGSLPAEHGLSAMRADSSGNVFYQDGPPVDIEHFSDELVR